MVVKLITSGRDITEKLKALGQFKKRTEQLEEISHINAHEVRARLTSILVLCQFFT